MDQLFLRAAAAALNFFACSRQCAVAKLFQPVGKVLLLTASSHVNCQLELTDTWPEVVAFDGRGYQHGA